MRPARNMLREPYVSDSLPASSRNPPNVSYIDIRDACDEWREHRKILQRMHSLSMIDLLILCQVVPLLFSGILWACSISVC